MEKPPLNKSKENRNPEDHDQNPDNENSLQNGQDDNERNVDQAKTDKTIQQRIKSLKESIIPKKTVSPEKDSYAEKEINDRLKSFLSEEDYQKIKAEGFFELPQSQQALITASLDNVILGEINYRARQEFQQKMNSAGEGKSKLGKIFARMKTGVLKNLTIAQEEKRIAQEYLSGQKHINAESVLKIKDGLHGLEAVITEHEQNPSIDFVKSLGIMNAENNPVARELNSATKELLNMPESWGYRDAPKKQREIYLQAEAKFKNSRESMLTNLTQNMDEFEKNKVIQKMALIENKMRLFQHMNEEQNAAQKIEGRSTQVAMWRMLGIKPSDPQHGKSRESMAYFAGGATAKSLLRQSQHFLNLGKIGSIAIYPVIMGVAGFVGYHRGKIKAERKLRENSAESRRGNLNSRGKSEQKTNKEIRNENKISAMKNEQYKLLKELGDNKKRMIAQNSQSENSNTEATEAELATRLAGFVNMQNEIQDQIDRIQKKIDRLERDKTIHERIVSAESLTNKLNELRQKIQDEKDPSKIAGLVRMLERRVSYTELKMSEGGINFGSAMGSEGNDSPDILINNQYNFINSLNYARALPIGYKTFENDLYELEKTSFEEQNNKVDERLTSFLGVQQEKVGKSQKIYVTKQAWFSAARAVVTAGMGMAASDLFSEAIHGGFNPLNDSAHEEIQNSLSPVAPKVDSLNTNIVDTSSAPLINPSDSLNTNIVDTSSAPLINSSDSLNTNIVDTSSAPLINPSDSLNNPGGSPGIESFPAHEVNPYAIITSDKESWGVTQVLRNQIEHDPALQKSLGFEGGGSKALHAFAKAKSIEIAQSSGYMNAAGNEIRVKLIPDHKIAYELSFADGKPVVTEYTDGVSSTPDLAHPISSVNPEEHYEYTEKANYGQNGKIGSQGTRPNFVKEHSSGLDNNTNQGTKPEFEKDSNSNLQNGTDQGNKPNFEKSNDSNLQNGTDQSGKPNFEKDNSMGQNSESPDDTFIGPKPDDSINSGLTGENLSSNGFAPLSPELQQKASYEMARVASESFGQSKQIVNFFGFSYSVHQGGMHTTGWNFWNNTKANYLYQRNMGFPGGYHGELASNPPASADKPFGNNTFEEMFLRIVEEMRKNGGPLPDKLSPTMTVKGYMENSIGWLMANKNYRSVVSKGIYVDLDA